MTILIIAMPVIVFVWNFGEYELSSNISDWSSFGGFIGGIINTIVAIISLVILGYISFLVGKTSTLENKNLYMLQKKIEAYDEFARFIPKLNLIPIKMDEDFRRLTFKIQKNQLNDIASAERELLDMKMNVYVFREYFYFMFAFKLRYSHLFEYDFNSEGFQDLLDSGKVFLQSLDHFYDEIAERREAPKDIQEKFDRHLGPLVSFINALKEELE